MLSSTFSLRVASIVALLFAGCGMRSDMTPTDIDDNDPAAPSDGGSSTAGAAGGASASAIPSGGVPTIYSGGASAISSGGASMTASRSSSSLPSGGATPLAGSRASGGVMASSKTGGTSASSRTGGTTASSRTGGAGMPSGGTIASSGAGGSSRASVASPPICTGVVCPALPKTCKKIVQDPSACCPVCIDTGCPLCGDIKCAPGTHSETLPGECCPSCVADPLDACKKGQKAYEDLRKQFLDKYGSTTCQNSLECSLFLESNACITACNVPLPTSWVRDYQNNLASSAKSNCASCPPQDPVMCERMVASCLNGKCVAVNPS